MPGTPAEPRCVGWRWVGAVAEGFARAPRAVHDASARLLAFVLRPLLARRWAVARRNLELCFPGESPEAQSQRLAAHRRALARAPFEFLRAAFAPSAQLRGDADIEGLELLHEAAAEGRGVLLLTGHLLHTELAARYLVEALGAPIGGMVRKYRRHPCFEAFVDRGRRTRLGPPVDKTDTRAMVRALRAGGRLVYLADQDFREAPVFVPFFGVPAATFPGIPQLLKAGRANLLFLSMARGPDGRYRVRLQRTGLEALAEDAEAFARGYMALLEAAVRQAPDQYLWVHRRFKTRPPGEASPYAR